METKEYFDSLDPKDQKIYAIVLAISNEIYHNGGDDLDVKDTICRFAIEFGTFDSPLVQKAVEHGRIKGVRDKERAYAQGLYDLIYTAAKKAFKKGSCLDDVQNALYQNYKVNSNSFESSISERAILNARTDNYQSDELVSLEEIDESSLPPIASQALEYASTKELSQVVESVLSGLSEKERSLIKMRFYEEKTLREIGNKLNHSASHIRILESRILNKLRKNPVLGLLKQYAKDLGMTADFSNSLFYGTVPKDLNKENLEMLRQFSR